MLAGIPREVTLAPNVAPVEVMEVDVGVVIVGITFSGIIEGVLNVPSSEYAVPVALTAYPR
ncbi:MAG: hypothetical protein WCK88_00870 [bacterium]